MYKISQYILAFTVLTFSGTHAGILSKDLLNSFSNDGGSQDVIVEFTPVLNEVLSSSELSSLAGDDRKNKIVSLLQQNTQAMQAPFLSTLSTLGLEDKATPFWIDNKIAIKDVDLGPLKVLSAIPGPFTIRSPYQAKVFPYVIENQESEDPKDLNKRQTMKVQWGVRKINATAVWATGNYGNGTIVGVIDSGANVNHVGLKDSYKNDPYSWKDAFGEHKTPYDGNGHGTHCIGSICGTTNGIGVAPGAKWIACRGLDDKGSGNETTLLSCGQFMACPNNSTGNCTGRPNIVSNSWGGAIGGQTWFNNVIDTWKRLGIIPVFAIGNSGPGCKTAGSPGDQNNVISVGSTEEDDSLSDFSSRGPSLFFFRRKPEVSGPGREIVSASHKDNEGLVTMSGTSMACPHVSGAIALMLSARPNSTFDDVNNILQETAYKPKLSLFFAPVCSVTIFKQYPNNGYGNGRIDVQKAVELLLNRTSN